MTYETLDNMSASKEEQLKSEYKAIVYAGHLGYTRSVIKGEHSKAIEVARRFLAMGLPFQQVSDGTGLPMEEIKKLSN